MHLPNAQRIVFAEDAADVLEMAQAGPPETMLTAWFRLNRHDVDARQYLYHEIPKHYSWHSQDSRWYRRERPGRVPYYGPKRLQLPPVGRMFFVHPRSGELLPSSGSSKRRASLVLDRAPFMPQTSYPAPACCAGELCYLRILLTNVRGARSFEQLRTVNGKLCGTFQEAALRRGLVRDIAECLNCLRDAPVFAGARMLRGLFVAFLVASACPYP